MLIHLVWDYPSCVLRVFNYGAFLSLNVVLILENGEDPDEMQHYAGFHLGNHCFNALFSSGY